MKQTIYSILILLSLTATTMAADWKPIHSQHPVPATISLVSSNISTSVVQFKLDGFYLNAVKTASGNTYTVSVGNSTPLLQKNAPDLPKLTASVVIPDMAMMDVEVISSSFIDYPNIEIAPSKGNLLRDIDPASVPYEYGRVYNENKFFPGAQAGIRDPFILRDFRGQTIIAYPFQYNPITKTLRVYTEITVKLKAINNNGYNTFNRIQAPVKIDKDFSQAYNKVFLNSTSINSDYTPVNDYGRMLVICPNNYMVAMQPFVDWKNNMGIKTEMVDVASIGTTTSAIGAYVANYYTTNGLTFLLLVGDGPQIPTNTVNVGGPSDNAYGYLVGSDHYPDIFVGRFSAENVEQVNTMVNRTLEYEKSPVTTTDWFSKGFGIGSDQGPGDDNEYDYQHMRGIRNDLIGYSFSSISELYDGTQGGEDQSGNPTPAMVSSELNSGRSIINYVGHGSDNSWGTTGYSSTNVNSLSNNHMWPFIFSVACVNGNFVGGTCFAESWLRAKNANGPTGAIATLMSTINQSWNPPMEGQDEMDDILVEKYPDNIKRTFAGISMNGCMKMNETYGTDGNDMTDTWTVFGDPSVMIRTAMPATLAATHENQIFLGGTSLVIESPINGALAALSVNNQFITAGFISNGMVTLNFPAFQAPDTVELVLTAFNYLPYSAEIPVIPNNGPYLVYSSNAINDATFNNNGQADYGETVFMDLSLSNVGVLDANQIQVTVSSDDQYVTMLDAQETYPLVPSQGIIAATNGFSFSIANNVPDLHVMHFHFTAISGNDTWAGNFTVTAHAGILKYTTFIIDDSQSGNGNGKADPGETFDIKIDVKNTGTAPATYVVGQISYNNSGLELLSSAAQNYNDISAGQTATGSFNVLADANIVPGEIIPVTFLMTAALGLESVDYFNLAVGQIPVAVIDLDGNHNSGPAMQTALLSNSVTAQYSTEMPADLAGYKTLFVCLGVGTNKHILSTIEGQQLASFLDAGGKLYMEGGDTWFYDAKTAVHPKFYANGVMDGSGDLNTETAYTGQFADGLSFTYSGDNYSIDHLSPTGTAFMLFKNTAPLYVSVVACDAGSYRTIASSFEFGGMQNGDGASTKNEYMHRIIDFFGVLPTAYTVNFMGNPINICDGGSVSFHDYSTAGTTSWNWSFPGGNPSTSSDPNPVVTYQTAGFYTATLIASNGTTSDTLVKENYVHVNLCTGLGANITNEVTIYPNPASGKTSVSFGSLNGYAEITLSDAIGKTIVSFNQIETSKPYSMDLSGLHDGMYFATISASGQKVVKKIIVRK